MTEAIELTNAYAPEHLIIETEDYLSVAERIVNAGSVFLGSLTPESAEIMLRAQTIPCRQTAMPKHTAVSASTALSAR